MRSCVFSAAEEVVPHWVEAKSPMNRRYRHIYPPLRHETCCAPMVFGKLELHFPAIKRRMNAAKAMFDVAGAGHSISIPSNKVICLIIYGLYRSILICLMSDGTVPIPTIPSTIICFSMLIRSLCRCFLTTHLRQRHTAFWATCSYCDSNLKRVPPPVSRRGSARSRRASRPACSARAAGSMPDSPP